MVGGFVYTPEKAGRDLGELCETRNLGVKTTMDRAEILGMDADCVMYLGGAEQNVPGAIDDICAILESGKNVVSTSANFIYPKARGKETEDRLIAAALKGGVTYHPLGIMPGFVPETVALTLTRLSHKIDLLNAYETLMYNEYPSTYQMFDLMGFGYKPEDPTPAFSDLELVGECWRHSVVMVADAAGLKIDRVENFKNVEVATKDLTVAAGFIPKGTVAAINFGSRIYSGGKPKIVMQHFTRMDADLAPDWPAAGGGWTIAIEGVPSIEAKINVGVHGELHTEQACLATIMHAIHAVPYVIAAKPGIMTILDVPPNSWGSDAFHI